MSALGFWRELPRPIRALAPMEDVTDTVFRRIVASVAPPDVYFTEFVNADGLCSRGHDAVAHRLRFTETERPIVAQIWGNTPENYVKAARMIRALGFDGIDINMGCPVKKIVKNGACSALIENPALASELFHAACEGAGGLPVSIKTRLGFRTTKTEEWGRFLLELCPAVLTMHGRTARDMSDVPANWNEVAKVCAIRDEIGAETLVLGNGDVVSKTDLDSFPGRYGVDGVMVARGIFKDLNMFRRGPTDEESFANRHRAEKVELYLRHVALYRATWGDGRNFNIMKKFAKVYISGFPGAATLRGELMETSNYDQMMQILEGTHHVEAQSAT